MCLIEDKINELEGSPKKNIETETHTHINTEWRKQNLIRYMGYVGVLEGEDRDGMEQHLKR